MAQPRGDRSGPREAEGRGLRVLSPSAPQSQGTQCPHLLPIGSGSIAGSGPRCSWLGNEGFGRGGMVAAPPLLLTLQLEADAAGLGPGQPRGCWRGPPVPLHLAGAPRPQELALLA